MARSSGALAALTLLVGLVLGGAVGFVLGSAQTQDAAPPPSPTKPTAAPAAPPPVEEAAAPKRGARAKAAAGDAVAAAADDGPTTGTGTITGFVRTKDGLPLAGVVVRATPKAQDEDPDERAGVGAPARDVEGAVLRLAAKMRHEEATTRETTTDAEGRYTLTGLVAKPQVVKAWLAGWRVERSDRHAWKPVAVGARCDFKATTVTSIRAKVALPDGSAPEEAEVSYKDSDGDNVSTKCAHGAAEIEIEPGTYELTATAGPQGVYKSAPQAVTVAVGATTEVTLRLAGRPGVRGKVTFASDERPRQFRVAAVKLDGGGTADPQRLLGDAKSKWIDDKDEYALTDLEPGTYLVGLTFRGRTVGPSGTVTVGTDLATLDFVVDGASRDSVKVWVRGPDGELVHDVHLTCGSRGPGWSGENGLEAELEQDGSYRVEHYENEAPMLGHSATSTSGSWGADAKREYYLRVESASLGNEKAAYDPALDREITVRFGAPARLVVTLAGFRESPDKDRFAMTITPSKANRGNQWSSPGAKIDANGTAVFPPQKPATYEIALSVNFDGGAGGHRFHRDVLRQEVTLVAGDNPMTIPVPAFHDFVVAVEGASPAEGLTLERLEPGSGRAAWYAQQKPVEGLKEIAFDHVATGRYRIVARGAGDMLVSVPDERRVVFRPRAFNAMRVSIDVKGQLMDAGLAEGDLVVGLEGADFESGPQMEAALAAAKANATAKLTVLRGGRRIEVTVDPKRLDDGGSLVPWVR